MCNGLNRPQYFPRSLLRHLLHLGVPTWLIRLLPPTNVVLNHLSAHCSPVQLALLSTTPGWISRGRLQRVPRCRRLQSQRLLDLVVVMSEQHLRIAKGHSGPASLTHLWHNHTHTPGGSNQNNKLAPHRRLHRRPRSQAEQHHIRNQCPRWHFIYIHLQVWIHGNGQRRSSQFHLLRHRAPHLRWDPLAPTMASTTSPRGNDQPRDHLSTFHLQTHER